MASTPVEEIGSEVEMDSSLMNELLYSLGRLKFSMRTLGTMSHQMAMHPTEEGEIHPDSDFIQSLESNEMMENVMKEDSIRKSDSDESDMEQEDLSKEMARIEELELYYEKLKKDLSVLRARFQLAFSEKS